MPHWMPISIFVGALGATCSLCSDGGYDFRTNSPRGMERERIRRYPAPWKPHKSDKELTVPEPFGLYGTEHAVEVPVPKVLRRRPFTPVPCGTALTSTRPFPFETAYDPAPMMMGQM